eukprot:CAMPEP_0181490286 /NCGR_PEP_ID=MMETSP1110-20121109/49466_1 /TAXON_ID=174948 /ORGANISM="Symbiodinium sp., Strain CCMP421" /LENGTH=359 /DNA_ID=CAMNT_0023617239 /DNA_START=87 /DNA_END=1167 /DNA_ORIENTATION=+
MTTWKQRLLVQLLKILVVREGSVEWRLVPDLGQLQVVVAQLEGPLQVGHRRVDAGRRRAFRESPRCFEVFRRGADHLAELVLHLQIPLHSIVGRRRLHGLVEVGCFHIGHLDLFTRPERALHPLAATGARRPRGAGRAARQLLHAEGRPCAGLKASARLARLQHGCHARRWPGGGEGGASTWAVEDEGFSQVLLDRLVKGPWQVVIVRRVVDSWNALRAHQVVDVPGHRPELLPHLLLFFHLRQCQALAVIMSQVRMGPLSMLCASFDIPLPSLEVMQVPATPPAAEEAAGSPPLIVEELVLQLPETLESESAGSSPARPAADRALYHERGTHHCTPTAPDLRGSEDALNPRHCLHLPG